MTTRTQNKSMVTGFKDGTNAASVMEQRSIILFKSCPRCIAGDLSLEGDIYGYFWSCVQCGMVIDIEKNDPVLNRVVSAPTGWAQRSPA